jgi:hypothetical protein
MEGLTLHTANKVAAKSNNNNNNNENKKQKTKTKIGYTDATIYFGCHHCRLAVDPNE